MIKFFSFLLKCLWHASSFVFSSGPADVTTREEPFTTLGLIGFAFMAVSFLIFSWFVIKFDKLGLRIFVSILAALAIVIIYFLIAYCFVC